MIADILSRIDEALAGDATVTRQGDAMRWHPGRVICDGGRVLWPELWNERAGTCDCTVTITADTDEFDATLAEMLRSASFRTLYEAAEKRSRMCSPQPLCINGQDYHRRLKARRRRKR